MIGKISQGHSNLRRRWSKEPAYTPFSFSEAPNERTSLSSTDKVTVTKPLDTKSPDNKPPLLLEHLNRKTLAMTIVKPPVMDDVSPKLVWFSLGGSIRHPQRTEFSLQKISDCLDGTVPFATYPIFSRDVNISIMKDSRRATVTAQVYETSTQDDCSARSRPFSEYDKEDLNNLLAKFAYFWYCQAAGNSPTAKETHSSLFTTIDSRILEAANRSIMDS